MTTEFHLVITDDGEYIAAYSTVVDEPLAAAKLYSVLSMVYAVPVSAVYRGRVEGNALVYEMPVIRIDLKYGEAYPDRAVLRAPIIDGVDFVKKMVCEGRLPTIVGVPSTPSTREELGVWSRLSKAMEEWREVLAKTVCSETRS